MNKEDTGIRVWLRAVEPEDVDFMLECEADRDAAKWSDSRAPLSRNQLLTYALTYEADPFAAGQLRLIVTAARDGLQGNLPVGIVDIYDISEKDSRAFVGICIHPDFRHEGYGASAMETLRRYNDEKLGLERLLAKVSTQNVPALRLFEKSGFSHVALLPRWHKIGTVFHDFHLLAVSSEQ